LRDGFLDGLQIFGAGVKKEMDVDVDQAGEKRGVAKVDELGADWAVYGGADFSEAIVLNEDFAGREDFSGFDVEDAGSVKDYCVFLRGRSGLREWR